MTLRQLQYFLLVAERGHLTKAAEELHISQPSLSYTISELEKEFDMPLFEKSGRILVLTPCGAIFHNYIKQALKSIDLGVNAVKQYINSSNNIFNIGYIHSLSSPVVDELINQYLSERGPNAPPLSFNHILTNVNSEVLGALHSERLNFAFSLNLEPGISGCPVFLQDLYIIVAKDHPLANYRSVPFSAIKDVPMVRNGNADTLYVTLENLYHENGCEPIISRQANNLSVAISYVLKTSAFTVVPMLPTINFSEFSILRLENQPLFRPIYLAWKSSRKMTREETLFINFAKEHQQRLNITVN